MTERVLIVPIATDNWWAPLVRWFLGSKFNHIFILFEDYTLGGWWAIDIREDGAHIVPAEKSSLTRLKHAEFYEYKKPLVDALKASRCIVGSGYDWLNLASNIVRIFLWRHFKFDWLKPTQDPDRHTCYEWTIEFLDLEPSMQIGELEPSISMPGDIRNFMAEDKKFHTTENPLGEL